MHPDPHTYPVSAAGMQGGSVIVKAACADSRVIVRARSAATGTVLRPFA